jgi:hypothetical protein
LGGSVHAINQTTDAPVVASEETGVKVNADKTKFMVMFRHQGAGQHRTLKTDSSIDRLEEFKYRIFSNLIHILFTVLEG